MNSVSPETPAAVLVAEDEPLVRTYLSDVRGAIKPNADNDPWVLKTTLTFQFPEYTLRQ
jgi:hypothetical protein